MFELGPKRKIRRNVDKDIVLRGLSGKTKVFTGNIYIKSDFRKRGYRP